MLNLSISAKLTIVTVFTLLTALFITPQVYAACGGINPPCPSVPTLSGEAQPTTAHLTWTQSSNVVTTYYNLKRGSVIAYSGGATEYYDRNLPPLVDQLYQVQACNIDGCSAFSSTTTVKPTSSPPVDPTDTDAVTATEAENLLVKFTALWIALGLGFGVVYTFRYRYGG